MSSPTNLSAVALLCVLGAQALSYGGQAQSTPRPDAKAQPNRTPAIRAVQEKLMFLGYDPGPSNGLIGAKTTAALRQFQIDYGLDSTGKIDSRTSALLFVGASDAPTIYDAQVVHLDHPLHAGDTLAAMGGNAGIQIAGANAGSSSYNVLDSDDAVAARQLDELNANYIASVREDLRKDGGYVSSRDKYGLTPLHNAAQDGQATVARLLLAAKADVNAKAAKDGETPLVRALQWDHLTVVRVLLARGADVNAKDNEGRSPMHSVLESHDYMGEARCLELVALLVAHEIDVNAKDNQGRTPLDFAEKIGERGQTIAAFLREHGAKPGILP
jgi:peptidoglycan hydrolase-like protein with peptidoglycan-binding domain